MSEEQHDPAEMIEYETRRSIRDLARLHGFEHMRGMVAEMINEEAHRLLWTPGRWDPARPSRSEDRD